MFANSKYGSAAYRWYRAIAHTDLRPNTPVSDIFRALLRIGLIVISPARHRMVALCLSDDRLGVFVSRQPQLAFKYLRRNYLAATLNRSQRARILTFHFNYIATCFPRDVIQAVARDGVSLWRPHGYSGTHHVRLAVPDPVDNEGELALEYVFDGQVIYTLSFTFSPLSLFGPPDGAAALISRIQANGVDVTTLRQVAKEAGDIAPRHVLIFAMQGFLLALQQDLALAVSVAAHTVSRLHSHAISPASYDELFDALGGVRQRGGIYHLPVPFQEHEPAQATSSHRRRARLRQAARRRISEEVKSAATALLAPTKAVERPGMAVDVLGHSGAEDVWS